MPRVFSLLVGLALSVAGAFLVLVVGLVVVIGGAVYGWNWYSYGRHAARVTVHASADKSLCTDDAFPVFVGIVNRSQRPIRATSIRLEAQRPGRSTNLAESRTLDDDRIISSSTGWGSCWRAPLGPAAVDEQPRALVWSVAEASFDFGGAREAAARPVDIAKGAEEQGKRH